MIIKLKLVGNNEETNIEIDKHAICITDIFNYLMEHDLSFDEVSKIMFINNGKDISNETNMKFSVAEGFSLNIHLFVRDNNVKNELLKHIFNNNLNDTFDYSNDSNDDNDDINKLSIEDINKNNDAIVELFNDNDFTYLLKICLTKPDLINKVSSYLLNGNITLEIKNIDTDESFKYNETYLQLVELLTKLNINKTELEMKSTINHFEGNLNLSLRYLLTKY
jgi:hypothetical protein